MKANCAIQIWPTLKRYICFGLVGSTGIVVDMGVLFVLADPRMLGLNLSLSKVLAAEVALVSNFIWNELWTFGDISAEQDGWDPRLRRLVKFNLICAAGIGISILLLNIQVRLVAMNVYLSNLIAILIVSVWNFGLNLKFGWNRPKDLTPLEKGHAELIRPVDIR
jgi:dolichol-phosphate mannosyltransferase